MRELCKLKKDEIRALLPQLCSSQYICKKCARAAPNKTWLCKAISIAKLSKMLADDNNVPIDDPPTED